MPSFTPPSFLHRQYFELKSSGEHEKQDIMGFFSCTGWGKVGLQLFV